LGDKLTDVLGVVRTMSESLRRVLLKPMYRESFKTRRCVVPATGYIEFTGPKGDKTAHLFTRKDGQAQILGLDVQQAGKRQPNQ
jgi:putative SOS response-associated peptidase YedK